MNIPTLTPQQIAQARAVQQALSAALSALDSGQVNAATLPAAPSVTLHVVPVTTLSPEVATAVAASQEARAKFEAETQFASAVSSVLSVAAEMGKVLLPNVATILSVLSVALMVCLLAGCQAPVQDGAVQVGPKAITTPIVQADVASPSLEAKAGDVASPTVTIASSQPSAIATSQPTTIAPVAAVGDVSGTQTTTQKPVTVTIAASGSGWPLVAMLCVLAAVGVSIAYLRTTLRGRATQRRLATLQDNALATAGAIRDLGGGPQRDRLLGYIEQSLVDRKAWDDLIAPYRVRKGSLTGR